MFVLSAPALSKIFWVLPPSFLMLSFWSSFPLAHLTQYPAIIGFLTQTTVTTVLSTPVSHRPMVNRQVNINAMKFLSFGITTPIVILSFAWATLNFFSCHIIAHIWWHWFCFFCSSICSISLDFNSPTSAIRGSHRNSFGSTHKEWHLIGSLDIDKSSGMQQLSYFLSRTMRILQSNEIG